MSCEQLVAELDLDGDASDVFSIDEILSGPEIERSLLDDLDEDDWLDLLDIGGELTFFGSKQSC